VEAELEPPATGNGREGRGPWTIVCFAGVDWSSHKQRPQLLMGALAERGHRVVYVDNLGLRLPRPRDAGRVRRRLANWLKGTWRSAAVEGSGIHVESPLVLPFHHVKWMRAMTRRALVHRLRKRIPPDRPLLVWTYLCLPVVADVAEDLIADLLVYDWADDAAEHILTKNRRVRERIGRWEDAMAARADLLLVASAELLRRRGSSNPRTHVMPHGAQPAHGAEHAPLPEIAGLPHPRVGFVGSITEWIDLDLVNRLARARPQWSFVMVGPVKTRLGSVARRANVLFTGERPYEEIPAYLSSFDTAIIPYRIAPAIEAASPLKLREYLVHGLPVVSVDIPEVRPFHPPVRFASSAEEFLAALEQALQEGRREPEPGTRPWSWEECAEEVSRLIENALAK